VFIDLSNIGKYRLKELAKEKKGRKILTGFAPLQTLQSLQTCKQKMFGAKKSPRRWRFKCVGMYLP
jgi:hypothetical protein